LPKTPPTVASGESPFGLAVGPVLSPFPETTISSGPSGLTRDPTPTFTFFSSRPDSSFECKLDAGPYRSCSSPESTLRLAEGSHTFSVRATDQDANTDPTPASRNFTFIKATAGPGWEGRVTNSASGCSARVQVPFLDVRLVVAAYTEVYCPERTQLTIRSRLRADYPTADRTIAQKGCSGKPDCVRTVPSGFSYYRLACPRSQTQRHNSRYYSDIILYPGTRAGAATTERSRDATLSPYCLY
jgi:hypothetical protein